MSSKVLLGAGIAVGVVVVGAAFYLRNKTPEKVDPVAHVTESEDAVLPDVPAYAVDAGRYFDIQLGQGPLADIVREKTSVPLMKVMYGKPVFDSILKGIEFNDGKAVLLMRPGIYWSDGKLMTGQHIVEGFERAKIVINNRKDATEDEKRWVGSVSMTRQGNVMVDVFGFRDEVDLWNVLKHDLVRPIRKDLHGEYPGAKAGFLVSIGPYRLKDINEDGKLILPRFLEFEPNNVFFQGPPAKQAKLDLTKIFPPPST